MPLFNSTNLSDTFDVWVGNTNNIVEAINTLFAAKAGIGVGDSGNATYPNIQTFDLDVNGELTVTGNANYVGNLHVDGAVTFSSTLGVDGIVSANNTTQSTSSSTGAIVTAGGVGIAKDLYVGGNVDITGNLTIGGNIDSGDNTVATDTVTFSSTIDSDILPSTTGTYNLGSPDRQWESVYLNNSIVFEGSGADEHETTLTAINPAADVTLSLPAENGTVATQGFSIAMAVALG